MLNNPAVRQLYDSATNRLECGIMIGLAAVTAGTLVFMGAVSLDAPYAGDFPVMCFVYAATLGAWLACLVTRRLVLYTVAAAAFHLLWASVGESSWFYKHAGMPGAQGVVFAGTAVSIIGLVAFLASSADLKKHTIHVVNAGVGLALVFQMIVMFNLASQVLEAMS